MRKLASIQRIKKIHIIPKFDNLVLVEVLGWKCLVKKDEFHEGDYCIYFEIDSILPIREEFVFMEKYKYRVKTIKMRGVYSQGLCMPVETVLFSFMLPGDTLTLEEGKDVTELLGVTKFEEPGSISGEIEGLFPMGIPKTDEERIQTIPEIIERCGEVRCYVSEKIDGSSTTIALINDNFNNFIVCSRNMQLRETEDNALWKIVNKYNLKEKIMEYNKTMKARGQCGDLVIQGEAIGPKIQKNKYQLKEQDVLIFNIMTRNLGEELKYVNLQEMRNICFLLGLKTVPILDENFYLQGHTVDSLVDLSKGKSVLVKDGLREGIVIRDVNRSWWDIGCGLLSFKVVNPEFLVKNERE